MFLRSDFSRYKNYPNQLSSLQKDVVVGTLLGDSWIPKSKGRYHCFGFEQTIKKFDYVDHVHQIISPFTENSKIREVINDKRKWGKGIYKTCRFRSMCHPVFSAFRKDWYKDGIKVVPDILTLNWRRLAYWFADDGHNRKGNKKEIVLSSQSFTLGENERLSKILSDNFGVFTSVNKRMGKEKMLYYLRVRACSYFDFIDGVSPYLSGIESMMYKMDVSGVSLNCNPHYTSSDKKNVMKLWELGDYTKEELAELVGCHKVTLGRWIKSAEKEK